MRRRYVIAIIVVILVTFGGLVGKRMKERKAEKAVLDATKPAPMKVEGVLPVYTTVRETLKAPGTVAAKAEVQIVPKASGRIASLLVDEGSYVLAGQLLAEIEHHELDAQIAQAKAAIANARSAIAQAKVNSLSADTDLKRMETLYREQAISQQQWDGARVKAQLNKEGINAAEAQLAQAQANVRVFAAQLANCRITAPISGQITKRYVDLGAMAAAGQAIVTVAQTGSLRAEFDLPERQLARLRLRQGVLVASVAEPDAPVRGTISEISPVVDPQTRLVRIKVALPAGGIFRPGLSVDGQFILAEKANALSIPLAAISQREGKSLVMIDDGGKVAERSVKTGLRSLNEVEVLAGIQPTDRVIIVGQSFVKAGDPVTLLLKGAIPVSAPASDAPAAPDQKGA